MPGPPVQFGPPITNNNARAGFNFIPNGVEEKNLYYYHPDHLGSSSYITDKNGEVIQHTEYMAFGEVLVDEHSVSPTQPYLFNGKELDYETGLYYYGARYYDPKVSIFLNVDPLVEKTGTPYAYTYNNPINLIDPTGMEGEDPPVDKNKIYNNPPWQGGEIMLVGQRKEETDKAETTTKTHLFYRKWSIQQQQNIDNARNRLSQALQNCSDCQALERGLFVYLPMVAFGGGLSTEISKIALIGKSSISIGTQLAVNQDVNLVKLAGDMFFNPVSGSVVGNSAEFSVKNIFTDEGDIFKVSSYKNFGIGVGIDAMFMGRNHIYNVKNPDNIQQAIQTTTHIQSELSSQIISNKLQKEKK